MKDVSGIIHSLSLPERVAKQAAEVYGLIAEAESAAHGVPVDQIHFHEVGDMDAIADVTAVCFLMDRIQPDRVLASPVHVGSGHVRCAHGIMPVPAPATAYLLKGIPTYGGAVQGELCTPTGAALLRYFVSEFTGMPEMAVEEIGYGMGKKDFESANCVRIFLGEGAEDSGEMTDGVTDGVTDDITELRCNVDDMTGEEVGYALEKLLEMGAREAFATPVIMKKSRPGIMVTVICSPQDKDAMVEGLFRYTTTIGIRESSLHRYVLERQIDTVDTPFGPVRRKTSSGYGIKRVKYEHDDLARIADRQGTGIRAVRRRLYEQDN